jgi:hypothetical protein
MYITDECQFVVKKGINRCNRLICSLCHIRSHLMFVAKFYAEIMRLRHHICAQVLHIVVDIAHALPD